MPHGKLHLFLGPLASASINPGGCDAFRSSGLWPTSWGSLDTGFTQVRSSTSPKIRCCDCLPVIFGVSKNYPSALNLSFQHRTIWTISVLSPTMIHFDSYQPELHWSGPLRHRTIPGPFRHLGVSVTCHAA